MTTTAPFRRLAATVPAPVLAAAALLTATPAASAAPAEKSMPRHFELVAQTPRATVWAERCAPALRTQGLARTASATWAMPQPDPEDLTALAGALRSGDLEASGVRVVETHNGPMLALAARRPGAPLNYFMICNARIRTSYE